MKNYKKTKEQPQRNKTTMKRDTVTTKRQKLPRRDTKQTKRVSYVGLLPFQTSRYFIIHPCL